MDVLALQNAFNLIIDRHEIFRTIFTVSENQPFQVILDKISFSILALDWRQYDEREIAELLSITMMEQIALPFDLQQGPLIRALLIKLKNESHILLVAKHHIIFDGWSRQIFLRELSHFYNSYIEKKELVLPPIAIHYTDFSEWQRNWIQQGALQEQLKYWKEQLAILPEPLELPTYKSRPTELSHQGAFYCYPLNKLLTNKVKKAADDHQVTLFMLLLAVFQILLHRYTDQDDIVIGTPIANRHYPQIEGLIGFFVNTLVLRVNVGDNPTFSQMLSRIKNLTLDAYENQDIPFEQLVDNLNVKRELNRHPIFQIMFAMQEVGELDFNLVNTVTDHLSKP